MIHPPSCSSPLMEHTAYDFEVDGIYYKKNSDGTSVSVTRGSNKYIGSVTIPSQVTYSGTTYSVTSIGEKAFSYCSGLTSVTIPNSVTSIGKKAFEYCSGLTSVTIPNSVTSIGEGAFRACSGLKSINVENGNKVFDSRNDCNAIIESSTNTLIAGCRNTIIPNSVTAIGDSAFHGSSGLTSVTIPNSVTSIGSWAFSGCSGLTSVTIPNSVTTIWDWAFVCCSGLTSVTIPNSVTKIGEEAFSGCSSLTSLYSFATVPPTCEDEVFDGIDKSTCILYVPEGCISAYQAADQWKEFYNIYGGNEDVSIDGGVEVSLDGGVLHCGGVDTVVYTLSGAQVYSGSGDVELAAGAYIVVANGHATKVVVK